MIDVGLDFGSTTTTVSIFDVNIQEPHVVRTLGGLERIPSIVAYNKRKGNYLIGNAAKTQVNDEDYILYKGFKMLLVEPDLALLKRGNYTAQETPAKIAKIFIEQVLNNVLADLKMDSINHLTVGVPEIWRNEIKTVDAVAVLRDICHDLPKVNTAEVQICSEPEAAAAFIASREDQFSGYVLLIDYGGGTLDITLTEVMSVNDNDGCRMQIKSLERTGAGENADGKVGLAGIAYMENVLFQAIKEAGLTQKRTIAELDEDEYGDFIESFYELESRIIDLKLDINEVFSSFVGADLSQIGQLSDNDLEDLHEEFTRIRFQGNKLKVTYLMLLESYNNLIRSELDQQLEKIKKYMTDTGILTNRKKRENLRIAVVGGFGTYYLVDEQINQFFGTNFLDRIMVPSSVCEYAISLGAALFASRIVELKITAPYSIGLVSSDMVGREKKYYHNYAFRYRDEIEFDKKYFVKSERTGEDMVAKSVSGSFGKFVINFERDETCAGRYVLKDQYFNRLKDIITNKYHTANVAFSLDNNGIVSIHVFDYDRRRDKRSQMCKTEVLAKLNDMFDLGEDES